MAFDKHYALAELNSLAAKNDNIVENLKSIELMANYLQSIYNSGLEQGFKTKESADTSFNKHDKK